MAAGRRKPTASHSARTQAHAGTRRARLWLLGAVVVTTLIVFAWFPGSSLLSQRASLAATEAELSSLHKQDAALAQEKKSLSDAGEIGRIAREQYQLVSPGQQAYEVLPPSGATSGGSPYTGDPGSRRPVAPTASAELPPGGIHRPLDCGGKPAVSNIRDAVDLLGHGLSAVRDDVEHQHLSAMLRKGMSDLASHALAATGHDEAPAIDPGQAGVIRNGKFICHAERPSLK